MQFWPVFPNIAKIAENADNSRTQDVSRDLYSLLSSLGKV